MDGLQPSYAALEEALRSECELSCLGDMTKGGYSHVAYLRRGNQLVAFGAGLALPECLAAVEQDWASGGPAAREFESGHCPVCALNRLAPVGSPDAVSAFDGYLRAPNRGFEVCCRGEWFRFRAHWWRKVYTSREIIQEVIRDRVLVRWEHGDFAFETGPVRGKEKWLAQTKTTARPPGSKKLFPTEEREVEVFGGSLTEVLDKAEGLIAEALREDEEWYRRTSRLT